MHDATTWLHRSLDQRHRPEAVARVIAVTLSGKLTATEKRILIRAAGSPAVDYSSMSDDFDRPVPAEHKVRRLLALFELEQPEEKVAAMAADPFVLKGNLAVLCGFLGWAPGIGPELMSRLNREARDQIGVQYSARRYRKMVRQMKRTAVRAQRLIDQIVLLQMQLVGRSGMAYTITEQEMRADPFAAAFVAYWTAQRNRRRAFTLQGRDNPFDTVAAMLLSRCEMRGDATDWWMIARVYPAPQVLARLDQLRLGELLGYWYGYMRMAGDRLAVLAQDADGLVDWDTMIVQRGVDSSTWNTVAGAYNQARTSWIGCLDAAGALRLLNVACPGKAMRMIAADLAAWHRSCGGDVDKQTRVWADLPRPWDVLNGRVSCTARAVTLVCVAHGVEPREQGWTAPRHNAGVVADWKPTPELVHGVEVTDPVWAGLLRSAGWFSGKPEKPGQNRVELAVAYYADDKKSPQP